MKILGKSIYEFDSGISGPRLMVLGGVHGNELTGIQVVKKLVASLSVGEQSLSCGSFVLALGNLKAIEKNMRGSVPHADMNRVFIKEKIECPSDYEEFRASELAPTMASSDFLIDIHSTNKPSVPFAVAKDDHPIRIRLAKFFPTKDFLVSPPDIIDGTTDVWVTAHGGYGLGYESGITTDVTKVPETLAGIERILVDLEMMEKDLPVYHSPKMRISRLEEAIVLSDEGFAFAEKRGMGSFEAFSTGELLGYVGSRSIRAKHDGLLMFPKLKEHQKVGNPVCFLASTE